MHEVDWMPDLKGREGPTYRAMADAIVEAISNGTLAPGDKLPPQRNLAFDVGVTLGTVSRAYALAAARGYVGGEVGRGTYVLATDQGRKTVYFTDRAGNARIDMRLNEPPDVGQNDAIARTAIELLERPDRPDIARYNRYFSEPSHRAAGVDWLSRYGIDVPEDRVIVTMGAAQGISTAIATATSPGGLMLTDPLVYGGYRDAARTLSVRLEGVAMDEQGLLPDALDHAARTHRADGIFMVPTFQNPTTATMSMQRRQDIADVARHHQLVIVEDDVYGLCIEPRQTPIATLYPEGTIFLTSLSKSVAPGLRIGYLACPERLAGRAAAVVHSLTLEAPPLMAAIAAEMIANGEADQISARINAEIARRRTAVMERLERFNLFLPPGCFHGWLHLPDPWRANDFVEAAESQGILIGSAEKFAIGRASTPHAIRIALGAPRTYEDAIWAAEELGRLLDAGPMALDLAV